MQTHEIRDRFTQHFVDAGHVPVPSASLILDDPTLLFVNAGMVPFKPYFLGQQNPPFESGTATSIQKCVRTLDIEEVGITTRHNTFFQMAGNFSFGQYFKEGAITLAWELLTKPLDKGGFALDPERLWVTVFTEDDEAAEIWEKKIGVPAERIQRLGMEDNFWSMGVPGPCGPCSEIYYDRGPEHGKEGGPIADDNRYMEIWNLVFMESIRGEGDKKGGFDILGELPNKNIDTGLGIERLACILQGVDNVYETDLLAPVIATAEKLTGTKYGANQESDVRFRVIADHSRTAMMIILDGVTPSNEGRGYILRRLLRRIIRSARLLGAQSHTIEQFINTIMDTMTPSFPEIADNRERILRVAVAEEKTFLKTLESGTHRFDEAAAHVKESGAAVLSGEQAFELHDTYGFPIDLTLEMAAEAGLDVDMDAFHAAMEEQRNRAKADSKAKKTGNIDESLYREWVDAHPTEFVGFEELEHESKVLGLVRGGEKVGEVAQGDEVEVILDVTPMYAEGGGQLADRGRIVIGDTILTVHDVQKVGNKKLWVHKATVENGGLDVGQVVRTEVDPKWRHGARQAHTATHLIHAALRQVLGPTAVQAGSMNKPGYLRFDFNYTEQLSPAQLEEISLIANQAVDADFAVNTFETSLAQAKEMGALALFGENYGDQVRVVEIGGPFSIELCGGTHVEHSSQIGPVAVLGESSVGSGARRIEAYSGMDSFSYFSKEAAIANALAGEMKAPSDQLPERIAALTERLRAAEKEIENLHKQQLANQTGELINNAETIGDVKFLGVKLPDGVGGGDLRTMAQDLRGRFGETAAVIVLASDNGGKVPFAVAATPAAVDKGIKSGAYVGLFGGYIGGKGGGKPDLAQGSGSDAAGIDAGFNAVREELSRL
ncbi:alanine--tRNA ligase [Corynebacterium sp. MSK044]|uniref:alanine--tRNA ligase n=1 Tax=unclassified Corynebacterium TaxID=2624378 RepID=UPI002549D492|nr:MULTISPECIES: alanine--tRNA ligase [unclassified Corynebacterium]MDK8795402.1 alanine--tRNA ligase [Corynebacterium sp. MSK041]MDK8796781.1 alanine--tRNA ligase [Corynebacterium sp. MSK044]